DRNRCGGSTAALGGASVSRVADLRGWLGITRGRGVLLAGAWLLLALRGLGDVAIVHSDESREVGIVQDIVAGHLLWPRFNEEEVAAQPALVSRRAPGRPRRFARGGGTLPLGAGGGGHHLVDGRVRQLALGAAGGSHGRRRPRPLPPPLHHPPGRAGPP